VTEIPGLVQRDNAGMTRTTAASVSSLLQGLERRGLVERRTEDGDERSKRVYPTPAAREVIDGFEAAMTAIDEEILAPLAARERDELQRLLAKITAELPEPTR
jgi:MarR family transcriptional regulator, repressor for mepA